MTIHFPVLTYFYGIQFSSYTIYVILKNKTTGIYNVSVIYPIFSELNHRKHTSTGFKIAYFIFHIQCHVLVYNCNLNWFS